MIDEPKIGIWGPTGSGKTTFLGALYLELQKDWTIVDQSSKGKDSSQLTIHIANALSSGEFPPATPRESKHYALFFHPNPKSFMQRITQRKFGLSLIEAPGDFIGKDPGLRPDDAVRGYYEHLSECSGLVLMIDPDIKDKRPEDMFGIDGGTYFLALQKLFQALDTDNNGKIRTKLAICLTKVDLDICNERLNELETFVYEIIGEDAKHLINSKCVVRGINAKVKYFGVSSVGMYAIADHPRPNIRPLPRQNEFEIAKPHERRAINVTDPIDWLLK